jgi:tRNA threonylcarbamoyladenosine biosynthesis protein TsaB
MACLDARMGEVYCGCFAGHPESVLVATGSPAVGTAAAFSDPSSGLIPFATPFHGIGRGFAAYPSLQELPGVILMPGAREALPDARDMAPLGALRLAAGGGLDPADLTPLYLRDKVALTEAERAALKPSLA